jgi:dihydrofolate reductase
MSGSSCRKTCRRSGDSNVLRIDGKLLWRTILETILDSMTRIVRDLEEIRKLKQQPGKNIHVVGGATLVGSLINASLIDEVRVLINPVLLGGGKALFKDVKERKVLKQVRTKTLRSGKVSLSYIV